MQFHQKTVFITGASRGIGAATARAFWKRGANVVGIGRTAEDLESVFSSLNERSAFHVVDITNENSVKNAIDEAVQNFGSIDIVINNAAILGPMSQVMDTPTDAFAETININLIAAHRVLHLTLPHLIAARGTAINISSGAAYGYLEGWSGYCASKAGLLILTQAVHAEYGHKGLRMLGLSPGTVATQMQREIKASGVGPVSKLDWSDHRSPQAVAKALLWMCTPAADPYLGQDVKIRDENVQKQLEAF